MIQHIQINIDQRNGRKYLFFKIWMWAVQVLLHLLEYIIIFSHGGLSQICHTIFNGKDAVYFFIVMACGDADPTNLHK